MERSTAPSCGFPRGCPVGLFVIVLFIGGVLLLAGGGTAVAETLREEVTLPTGETVIVESPGPNVVRMTLPNGHTVTRHQSGATSYWTASMETTAEEMEKAEQAYELVAAERPARRERSVPVFLSLLLIGAGLLNVVRPRAGWYLSTGWKFRNAEPSDLALFVGQATGILLVIAGIITLLAG